MKEEEEEERRRRKKEKKQTIILFEVLPSVRRDNAQRNNKTIKHGGESERVGVAGEPTWWIRALVALAETGAQFSAPTWKLTTVCNSISMGSDAFFWFPRHCTHSAHTYRQANTHVQEH